MPLSCTYVTLIAHLLTTRQKNEVKGTANNLSPLMRTAGAKEEGTNELKNKYVKIKIKTFNLYLRQGVPSAGGSTPSARGAATSTRPYARAICPIGAYLRRCHSSTMAMPGLALTAQQNQPLALTEDKQSRKNKSKKIEKWKRRPSQPTRKLKELLLRVDR